MQIWHTSKNKCIIYTHTQIQYKIVISLFSQLRSLMATGLLHMCPSYSVLSSWYPVCKDSLQQVGGPPLLFLLTSIFLVHVTSLILATWSAHFHSSFVITTITSSTLVLLLLQTSSFLTLSLNGPWWIITRQCIPDQTHQVCINPYHDDRVSVVS